MASEYGFVAEAKHSAKRMSALAARDSGLKLKRRIMLGTYALSAGYYGAYYVKAQQVRP